MLLTPGQTSDITGAKLLYEVLPSETKLIADKGYDSDEWRAALRARDIEPCIPGRSSRKVPVIYCKQTYKLRYLVEIIFSRIKDWRRVATRYDRLAVTFFAAICIAALVTFYI